MGYASRPLTKEQIRRQNDTIVVPHVAGDWIEWFRWHARLAGVGAIVGPSRPRPGAPEVGPRVVEMLPVAPSLALPPGGRVPPEGGVEREPPPNPGWTVRH